MLLVSAFDPSGTVAADLRARGVSDVRDDPTARSAYSSDASLYRGTPSVVVCPRDVEEVMTVLDMCREREVPLTSRGAGTSVAGNAIGSGVILDFSRHMNKVLDLDPDARAAVVQPGTVHATLQKAALAHGLRFGPDPSTHTRCTVGGMIGNNACGSRTLGYGRTSDNVLRLDVLTGSATRMLLTGDEPPATRETRQLRDLVRAELATIRTEFGRFGRQVSGYALEHLAPERGFDVRRALVGSEGTLAVVLEAQVRLVAEPAHRVLAVLGYPDIGSAGDAVTAILPFSPSACEGLDSRIVDVVTTRKGPGAVPDLPGGAAWLLVELAGDDLDEVAERAAAVVRLGESGARVVTEPVESAALWKIREDGAGLSGRSPAGAPAHSGWEDAAVPPQALGRYLRDFDALLLEHGLTGMPYGHFGDGCVHIRLDVPFARPDGTPRFRAFMTDAAKLVSGYGGSLSGEHGDGRARSELLPYMYSADAIALMGKVKTIFDPGDVLNPGVLVRPRPLDADIRAATAIPVRRGLALAYGDDDGDFSKAVHRCTGVGKCRAEVKAADAVMCPSYLATREEKDSTRGRARVLQEMIAAAPTTGRLDWGAPEVHDALDLCLSCKGCRSDCPTGVDMAAFKSEVLHQTYRRRPRPATHYSLGRLPRWARLASLAPRAANLLARLPGIAPMALAVAGVDRRRRIPPLAPDTFRDWFLARQRTAPPDARPVTLWVDTFTNYFSPEVGKAAVRVLERAGCAVRIPDKTVCCGLTWISTGQLDAARRILGKTVATLAAGVEEGVPIVALEPSCTGVFRSDALELLGEETAGPVAAATHTLAEFLSTIEGWTPPSLDGVGVVAQPHCHHHAVMGWNPDVELLAAAGARVRRLGGCCGLAGNFGVERGHYEVSVAVAEQQLLPAVRAADPDTVILADGFSCRTQLADLSDRHGIHLAQLLDRES